MKKEFIVSLFLAFILLFGLCRAEQQPIQQYNKIYLSPFYRDGITANTNYTYTIYVKTYDGISKVVSAIINFDVWLMPSLNVSIWVNGKSCNTPYYYVSTTYASAMLGRLTFDCSNIIEYEGTYNITIRASRNTGAITGWLDLTYMNRPKPKIEIKGTEYVQGEIGKVFLQLLDENKKPINNSVCFTSIYYHDNMKFIDNQEMTYVDEGLYQYEFTAPYIVGVYMVSANCKVPNPYSVIKESYDDFECGSLNCGYGWSSNWTTNAYAYVSSLASYEGTYGLRITGTSQTGGSSERNFTKNTSAETITISFYARAFSIEGGEYAYVYYCNSTSCRLLKEFSSANSDGLWHYYSFTLIPCDNTNCRIKINSTLRADDYLDLDNIKITQYSTFNETQYIEVRGSGEIHINPIVKNGQNVYVDIVFDGFSDYYLNGSEYPFEEGLYIYNISITSQSKLNNQPVLFFVETDWKCDCSSITELVKWNGTEWIDALNEITWKGLGSKEDNCKIKIETTINSGETKNYRLSFGNYQKWEILWSMDTIKAINDSIYETCINYSNGFNYEVPITKQTERSSDKIIDFCHRLFDDIYWANYIYEEYLNDIYGQEGYLTEISWYRSEIQNKYHTLYLMTLQDKINMTFNPSLVWNYPSRTLTDYNQSGIFNYLNDINNTINLKFESVISLLEQTNNSIHNHINYTQSILNSKLDNIRDEIISELNYIKDKLNDNNQKLILIYNLIQETNETIMNKLYSIQNDIQNLENMISELQNSLESTKQDIIDMILNISNATYNISVSQEEVIGTMISLYGEKSKGIGYSLAGFMTGVSAYENAYYTCKDNETLVRYEIINIGGDLNKTYITTREVKCSYGCLNNSCVLSPYDTILILLGVIGLMFFIYYFVFKKVYEEEYEW